MSWLPLLALPSGYLLGWFFYGVSIPWMAIVLFGGAALWAQIPSGSSRWTFGRSFMASILVGFICWVIYWAFVGLLMVSSPNNPLPIGWPQLIPLLLLGVGAIIGSVYGLRWLADQTEKALPSGRRGNLLAPWMWLAGVLLFAFFPAVRVDCRQMMQDSFLRYGSGFSGLEGQNDWGRQPHLIPDRAELPGDFQNPAIQAGAIHCDQDARGRRRPLSFRASSPLIAVRLSERLKSGPRTHYAAFTPGDHRKLTRWTQARWQTLERHWPYLNPMWEMPFSFRPVPEALERQLLH